MFYARSPRTAREKVKYIPAQTYREHIEGVMSRENRYLEELSPYCLSGELLRSICLFSGMYHDLGKLDEENQKILSGNKKSKGALPIPHWDAGVALLDFKNIINYLSSFLIFGHHKGLKNKPLTKLNFREERVKELTDRNIDSYIAMHEEAMRGFTFELNNKADSGKLDKYTVGTFLRVAMSCLVDADHTDSAVHCGDYTEKEPIALLPEQRLKALDIYVESLGKNGRNSVRREMYLKCSDADISSSIYSCDSPVGTGKTTAIMANLLKAAAMKNLRRIFVILPYTNIINQSVDVYRKALVLPDENPEEVVSALHHRTEYEDEDTRQFSALWNAPIIVTTAVQFFETLAAATPSALRKLHNLPGSAVFVDESHAALPAKLWVQGWEWINDYCNDFGCHFVLASGSLNRFWELEEFDKQKRKIPEILPSDFREMLRTKESERARFKFKREKMNENELCEWLLTLPSPRLLIVNTVQSAAVIAKKLKLMCGENTVEHISTALMPKDREKSLTRIKSRLKSKDSSDWTLVATSCVEAGVDFSFRTGIREAASLVSLLQTAGRVRRNGEPEYFDSAVWTVQLKFDGLLKEHPAFADSAKVLLKLSEKEEISPSLCTKALLMELKEGVSFAEEISDAEQNLNFETVEDKFKVINSDTVSVLIDKDIAGKLRNYEYVGWREIQSSSVQIWSNKKNKLGLEEIRPGIFAWAYSYDNFIGYMAGLLEIEEFAKEGFSII